jgi:hypothetical protein
MIPRAMLAVASATGRASHARQVMGDDPDKNGYSGPPGWGLGVRLTTPPHKKILLRDLKRKPRPTQDCRADDDDDTIYNIQSYRKVTKPTDETRCICYIKKDINNTKEIKCYIKYWECPQQSLQCKQQLFTDIDIDIFINCNWVDTRWQYTLTHKQYTEHHN